MADHSDIRFKAGQAAGQAQVKKDDLMDKAARSTRETNEEAGGFIQHTGEQVKNMAQGTADAVKNAVGMGDNASSGHTTTTTKTTVSKH